MKTALYGGKTSIIPLDVGQFISFIDHARQNRFSDPSLLKGYFDSLLEFNQEPDRDEDSWAEAIEAVGSIWAFT